MNASHLSITFETDKIEITQTFYQDVLNLTLLSIEEKHESQRKLSVQLSTNLFINFVPLLEDSPLELSHSFNEIHIKVDQYDELKNQLLQNNVDHKAQKNSILIHDPNGIPLEISQGEITLPPAIGWLDQTNPKADLVSEFYNKALDWHVGPIDRETHKDYMIGRSSSDIAFGVVHNLGQNKDIPNGWVPYFMIQDFDETYQRIKSMETQEICGPTTYDQNQYAIFRDPADNLFAIFG